MILRLQEGRVGLWYGVMRSGALDRAPRRFGSSLASVRVCLRVWGRTAWALGRGRGESGIFVFFLLSEVFSRRRAHGGGLCGLGLSMHSLRAQGAQGAQGVQPQNHAEVFIMDMKGKVIISTGLGVNMGHKSCQHESSYRTCSCEAETIEVKCR